ncbi:MAG: NAD(P)H-dependent oxidoreductase, partial [Chromatiales bacterium]
HGDVEVVVRDLREGIPFVDEAWMAASFTPEQERSEDQRAALVMSDALVEELRSADVLVIGTPIYNFGVPAALKAWIDMVARARLTFRYTEQGPVGLLEGKKAYVLVASGGTPVGSDIDFASGYLRHVLGFLGIHDVELIAADRLVAQAEVSIAAARERIDRMLPARAA